MNNITIPEDLQPSKSMLLKDKIILVYYVDVRGIADVDTPKFLMDFSNVAQKLSDESVEHMIIPVRETSRVECINPRLITDDESKKIEELIKKYNEYMKN